MKKISLIFASMSAIGGYAQTDSIPSQELNEVVVQGEKPQVKSENGAIVVDLPSIVKDKPVTNVLESLGYLPGVINQGGMIGLSGAPSTTIVVNGEVSQMSVQQLYQLLYSTPIERLKNVEVMYSAPAKYHVSGAVINVVLKTPTALDGLQGQARIGYDQARFASYGGSLSAVYATGKWTFDLNYSLSNSKGWQSEDMTSWHTLADGLHLIEEKDRTTSKSLSNLINGTVGYSFADNSVLRATYNGQIKNNGQLEHKSDGSLGSYINNSEYPEPIVLHNVSLSYKSAFGLRLTADYLIYREQRMQSMVTGNIQEVNSQNEQNINRYRFTADMEHDMNGWTLGYGAEYRLSDDKSKMSYIVPDNPGFNNELTEHSVEAYVSLQHSFPWGLSFQASVGEELYRMTGKNNWTFQPQFGLTYYTNPNHILQASFSTERQYASYWNLHGGIGYLNPYSEIWGNPSLRPSTAYSAYASYIFKQKYVATLLFSNIDDYTVQLPYQSPDELKLIFQELNLNYNRKIGFNFTAPFEISTWYDIRLTAQCFYNRIRADHFHDISFTRDRFTAFGMIENTFKIGNGLSVTLDASGITNALQGISDLSNMWSVDMGAKWSFGKSKCCELNVKTTDIFNRWSPTMRINYGNQNFKMNVHDMTRNLKVTFIYRFNGFNPKDTDLDTSRLGTK